jgi:hypothetical protein
MIRRHWCVLGMGTPCPPYQAHTQRRQAMPKHELAVKMERGAICRGLQLGVADGTISLPIEIVLQVLNFASVFALILCRV